jgi:hypothetical protein
MAILAECEVHEAFPRRSVTPARTAGHMTASLRIGAEMRPDDVAGTNVPWSPTRTLALLRQRHSH